MQISNVQRSRTPTLRVNNLKVVAAQVKALQIVDCKVLLRTSCNGLDTVVAQVECHQFVVSYQILDTANRTRGVNIELPVYTTSNGGCCYLLLTKTQGIQDLGAS